MPVETEETEYEKLTGLLQVIQLEMEKKGSQQIVEETEVPEDYPLLRMLLGDLNDEVKKY